MTMYTYKNKTDQELVLVGIGKVAPNQEFQTAAVIENPNIQLIEQNQPPQPETAASAPVAPAQVAVNGTEEVQQ